MGSPPKKMFTVTGQENREVPTPPKSHSILNLGQIGPDTPEKVYRLYIKSVDAVEIQKRADGPFGGGGASMRFFVTINYYT